MHLARCPKDADRAIPLKAAYPGETTAPSKEEIAAIIASAPKAAGTTSTDRHM